MAQLIPIFVAPVLSRMYTPENYGQLGVLMSVVGIFAIISTFQYESAIMLPKDDKDAFNLLTLSIIITIFVSGLSYIITSIFAIQIANILETNSFSEWIILIPIFVLLSGLSNSLNIWVCRRKQFKRLAFREISQSTVAAGTKLVMGWHKYLHSGLILGMLAGHITSTVVLGALAIKDSKNIFSFVSLKRIKENMIKYQNFPKYTMWQGFFDIIRNSGIILIASYHYGIATVGVYTFTVGLLLKPSKLLGQAVSRVFYQKVSSEFQDNKNVYQTTIKLLKNQALFSSVIFVPLLLFSPKLFPFIFGSQWKLAGIYAQVLAFRYWIKFIVAPIINLPPIYNKQKEFFFFSIIQNIVPFIILAIIIFLDLDFIIYIYAVTIFLVFFAIILIKWTRNYLLDKKE